MRPDAHAPVFGLIGTGGCARGIMPFARAALEASLGAAARTMRIVYVVSGTPAERVVNGVDCLSEAEFADWAGPRLFTVGIADSATRATVTARVSAFAEEVSLISPHAMNFGCNTIGPGAAISPFCTVAANVTLGRSVHLNLYSYVEHDCVVGDFVTFAPGAKCNGNIHIGAHAYIGSGAVIRHGKPGAPLVIGAHARIGMGAIVTRDVPPGTTVIGNPARKMRPSP